MHSDKDWRELLISWGEVAETTSMSVERLLASYKLGCPLDNPTGERFCASAMLSEWVATHVQNGGDDPKIIDRKNLIDSGAPLMAAKKDQDTDARKCRGNILYTSEEWKDFKRLNQDVEIDRDFYYTFRAEKMREYNTLPKERRDEYSAKASMPGYGRDPTASDLPMPKCENQYNGDALMDLASKDCPVRIDLVEELIKEISGKSEVGGFSTYEEPLRKAFIDKLFVDDVDAIPKTWKNKVIEHEQCNIKHPGLCQHLHRHVLPRILIACGILRKAAKGEIGSSSAPRFSIVFC
jgi:hypothetical protein